MAKKTLSLAENKQHHCQIKQGYPTMVLLIRSLIRIFVIEKIAGI